MSPDARTPDEISADIAKVRNRLAGTIDQLAYRAKPKTIMSRQLSALQASFRTDDGSLRTDRVLMVAGTVVGVVAAIFAIRKLVG